MDLLRGGPRRQREVEPVHEPGTPQHREAENRGLCLAGPGLALQDEERGIERRLLHRPLERPGMLVAEQASEVRGSRAGRTVLAAEALLPDRLFRLLARSVDVVRNGSGLELEEFPVGADLIGKGHHSREKVCQGGGIGQGRAGGRERRWEPGAAALAEKPRRRERVVSRKRLPELRRAGPGQGRPLRRSAVVRERGEEQGHESVSPRPIHVEESERRADRLLFAAPQCFADVSCGSWSLAGERCFAASHLELKARVQLPEIVQEGDDGEAGFDDGAKAGVSRRLLEAMAEDGIAEERLEARRHFGRVVLEAMEAAGRFILSPRIRDHTRLLVE